MGLDSFVMGFTLVGWIVVMMLYGGCGGRMVRAFCCCMGKLMMMFVCIDCDDL